MLRLTRGALGALLLAGSPAVAQLPEQPRPAAPDSVARLALPGEAAAELADYFNHPAHVRFSGPTTVGGGDTIRANVAALEGPFLLAGRVEGSVVVVNGDARLLPGASITGDLWVVGGRVEGEDSAAVGGEVVTHPERLRYRHEGARVVFLGREEREEGRAGSDFLVATGKSYNRVEGLPIVFGPRIRTAGSNPLRVHALAVYRTEAGFRIDTEQMGYHVRAEHFLGGRRGFRVGATVHSLVDPIEDWHLSDLESGLSTFLFHRDFRDHYEREGASVFATWEPRRAPLALTGEMRWERHGSLGVGNPWSLIDNAEPWRPQPLVAGGRVRSAVALLSYDSRNDRADPSHGWHLRGRLEQALHSDLVRPAVYLPATGGESAVAVLAAEPFGRYRAGLLDVRRYNRVDPRSRLNFRLLLAGPLGGAPLPPQRQHALGGEGTLPGYGLFSRDCGARAQPVYRTAADAAEAGGTAFFPRYGCEAAALFQAEYRGRLSLRLHWASAPWLDEAEEGAGWGLGWGLAPEWTVFVDAGRGWTRASAPDEGLAVDVGVGVLVSRIGLFLAMPLAGGSGINAFVRLGPRF